MRLQHRLCSWSVLAERLLPQRMQPMLGIPISFRHKPCAITFAFPAAACSLTRKTQLSQGFEVQSSAGGRHQAYWCMTLLGTMCSLGWTQALHEQVRSLQQRCIDAEALVSQLRQQLSKEQMERKASVGEAAAHAAPGDQHAGAGPSRRDATGAGIQHDSAGACIRAEIF